MKAIGQKVFAGRRYALQLCLVLVLVLSIAAPVLNSGVSWALPDDSDWVPDIGSGLESEPPEPCTIPTHGYVSLTTVGAPLVGWDVVISAADAKLVDCSGFYTLPSDEFEWELKSVPSGSSAMLKDSSTLTPSLRPDIAGEYLVMFTICPDGYDFTLKNGEQAHVDPSNRSLTINAVSSITVPAGTEPVLPPFAPSELYNGLSDEERGDKCGGGVDIDVGPLGVSTVGGGVIDPQWVTVEPWYGAGDYELLEGKVVKSRPSRKDNPLNHHSQDHLVHVFPDPPYNRLLNYGQLDIEAEWEIAEFPEAFRPTTGDRVSVFGFWILDCGHDPFKAEIHPPVGIAVHRNRPVLIPSEPDDFAPEGYPNGMGSNVWVPGIVTDIWFNRDAGEITSNCGDTGLAQPYSDGDCIQGPNTINRKFTFNIYLPPNPLDTLADIAGTSVYAPPVPLYIKTGSHPEYGSPTDPYPEIEVKEIGGVTYLEVTIDLRFFFDDTYQGRIEAGWAYPDANNWGLKAWKLKVISLTDIENSESRWTPWDDGDWRLWVNTNNADKEWTNVLWCDECVEDTVDFSGVPWETGATSERDLGPDILLFPSQRIWVHSSGWDEDWVVGDDTGAVNDLKPQQAAEYHSPSMGSQGSYNLNYEILAGDPVGLADLTPEAEKLHAAYVVDAGDPLLCSTMLNNCLLLPELTGRQPNEWYPMDWPMGQEPIDLATTTLFKPQPVETFVLTDISIQDLAEVISVGIREQPEAVDRTLRQLRDAADHVLESQLAADAIFDLHSLNEAIPGDLWERYFSGIALATEGRIQREVSDSNPEPGQVVTISIKPEDFSVPYTVHEEFSQGLKYTGAHTADSNPQDTVFRMLKAEGFSYEVRVPDNATPGTTFTISGKFWDHPVATMPIEATVITVATVPVEAKVSGNGGLIGGIVAVGVFIVAGLLYFFLVWRRRRAEL